VADVVEEAAEDVVEVAAVEAVEAEDGVRAAGPGMKINGRTR
jgi:hypothetical protein